MFCNKCGTPLDNTGAPCSKCYPIPTNPETEGFGERTDSESKNTVNAQNDVNNNSNTDYVPPQNGTQYQNGSTNQYGWNNQYNQNTAYTNPYYYQNQADYSQLYSKAENARIIAILGIVLSVLVSPICGWVMGGIALSHIKEVISITGNPEFKSTMTLAKASIWVASAIVIIGIIVGIIIGLMFAGLALSGMFLSDLLFL